MGWLLGFGIPASYVTIGVLTALLVFRVGINNLLKDGHTPKSARRSMNGDPIPFLAGVFWPVMPFVYVIGLVVMRGIVPLFEKPTKEEVLYEERQAIESAKEVVYGKQPADRLGGYYDPY